MPDANVQIAVHNHVATLTLDDPARRNAMTPELGDAFRDAVNRVKGDASVRAVVVTGAGAAFSGGGDLRMLERLRTVTPDESRRFMLEFYAKYLSVTELDVPTVAAVQGAAIGAGLCVALACDLCIVDEHAKLALNFVQLGLHPGMGATYLAPRRAGAMRGAELLLTGRRFDGKEAAALGMALRAVPADQTLLQATELAEHIARNAPLAVKALRSELGIDREALQKALEREAHFQAESYASKDLGEGLKAAAEKRTANFTGE